MKLGKEIHEIFLFYTPKLMDVYFQYLKNKIKKAVGVTTLLVRGSDLPNIHSESHMMNSKHLKVDPNIQEQITLTGDTKVEVGSTLSNGEKVLDLDKQRKIRKFSKTHKNKQSTKSCIINKKAS